MSLAPRDLAWRRSLLTRGAPAPLRSQELLVAAQSPHPGLLAGCAANTLVYVAGIKVLLKGLTWSGVATSWALGSLSYAGATPPLQLSGSQQQRQPEQLPLAMGWQHVVWTVQGAWCLKRCPDDAAGRPANSTRTGWRPRNPPAPLPARCSIWSWRLPAGGALLHIRDAGEQEGGQLRGCRVASVGWRRGGRRCAPLGAAARPLAAD
jgi:hypothetical protein